MRAIAVFLFPFVVSIPASSQIQFQHAYGGGNADEGYAIQKTTDGGYLIAGTTGSGFNYDAYLVKVDSVGSVLWTKTIGGTLEDYCVSIQVADDGGFVITGWTKSQGNGLDDIFLTKTNSDGTLQWTKVYGGSSYDNARSLCRSVDGGFLIIGHSESFGSGYPDVYLIKTNSTGDTLWTKAFGGSYGDYGYSGQQTSDGGYIIAGYTNSFGFSDVCLIKVTSNGGILWFKAFGGTAGEVGHSVCETMDGGFAIVGITTTSSAGASDVYLAKTDQNGIPQWAKSFGGASFDTGHSLQQTLDGGYIIVGQTNGGASIADDYVYLIKTDSAGDTLWTNSIRRPGDSQASGNFVEQTLDGGYIITGCTYPLNMGNAEMYLIKTDSDGNSGCNQRHFSTVVSPHIVSASSALPQVTVGAVVGSASFSSASMGIVRDLCDPFLSMSNLNNEMGLSVFPTVNSGVFEISDMPIGSEIFVYNAIGDCVFYKASSSDKASIDISGGSNGIYFIRVMSKYFLGFAKIIKQ